MALRSHQHGSEEGVRALRRRRTRRMVIRANVLVSLLLAAVLVLLVNFFASWEYARRDFSRHRNYVLSRKTQGLLDSLTNQVQVQVFMTPDHPWFRDVRRLLKEYQYASPLIDVQYHDPHRNLAQAEAMSAKYEVDLLDVIAFDAQGLASFVQAEDLVELDYGAVLEGRSPERTAFKGEELFSSAIQSVSMAFRPVVYMLLGHGERDIEDYELYTGYSDLARLIRHDNMELRTVLLGEEPRLPDDCDVLVIAGPRTKIPQPEMDILRSFLEDNGKMMVLADAATDTGLEALLAEWGILLADDVVVDADRTLSGQELFITDYGYHPLGRAMRGISSIFYLPRSVTPVDREGAPAPDRPKAEALAFSSPEGWAERGIDQVPMVFNEGVDLPGPVPVAAVAERGPVEGIEVVLTPTRLAVFGDSDFVANGAMAGGNEDLFMSTLNWLAERESSIGIAPKPVQDLRLVITRSELRKLFYLVVVGIPGVVGLAGISVWLFRRS